MILPDPVPMTLLTRQTREVLAALAGLPTPRSFSYRDAPIGTIRAARPLDTLSEGLSVRVSHLAARAIEIADLLALGGRVKITQHDRVRAVIEGVKS